MRKVTSSWYDLLQVGLEDVVAWKAIHNIECDVYGDHDVFEACWYSVPSNRLLTVMSKGCRQDQASPDVEPSASERTRRWTIAIFLCNLSLLRTAMEDDMCHMVHHPNEHDEAPKGVYRPPASPVSASYFTSDKENLRKVVA